MIAASKLQSDPALDEGNVFAAPGRPDLRLLRVAAIYGANAAGKSNVAQALSAFRTAVFSSHAGHFEVSPFLFDASSATSPCFFELTFLLDGAQYRYGFMIQGVKPTTIVEEWLYRANSAKETVLFERTGDEVDRKRAFPEGAAILKGKRLRRTDALFLSATAYLGGEISSKIVDYIGRMAVVSGVEDEKLRQYTENCFEEERYLDLIRGLIQEADTGISSIRMVKENDSFNMKAWRNFLFPAERPVHQTLEEDQPSISMQIQTEHPVFDAEGNQVRTLHVPMKLYESQGTQKLFAFAGPIINTLSHGDVLFVDEMDVKFHPMMTRALIRLFQSKESNPKNAQLIFITHDTNLLNHCGFRRDQVWFVEKDRFGASHLYSLAEFKGVRKQPSFEEDYMAGRFGAVPLLGDLERLFAQEEARKVKDVPDETSEHGA